MIGDKNSKIKQLLRKILFILVISLFPLNQQVHFREFITVDGIVLDYLITKVSLIQILILTLTLLNFSEILGFLKKSWKETYFELSLIFLFLLVYSVWTSGYHSLALWENFYMFLLFVNLLSSRDLFEKYSDFFKLSLGCWVIVVSLLSIFQFNMQESVLDNYRLFGEYPYSTVNYHIKDRSYYLGNSIPAYGIFSHPNILGGFMLVSLIFLITNFSYKSESFFKRIYYAVVYLFAVISVVLSGSLICILGLVFFLVCLLFKLNSKLVILSLFLILICLVFLSFFNHTYQGDSSIYRRLYQIGLSNEYFREDLKSFLIGFGYYNYFEIVSWDLYFYENIRFLQPPHNIYYLAIWNYGFLGLLIAVKGANFLFQKIRPFHLSYPLIVVLYLGIFDHYPLTNHQFKILIFLIIGYSIFRTNNVKIS